MSSSANLPVLLAQIPHVQKLQNLLQYSPDRLHNLTAQEALKNQEKSKENVSRPLKSEKNMPVTPDGQKDGRHFAKSKKRTKQHEDEKEQKAAPKDSSIIDIKV